MLLALALTALASAAEPASNAGWQAPNTFVQLGVGAPWPIALHGEAMLSEDFSGELGIGLAGQEGATDFGSGFDPGFDYAIRYRPDFACFGCGGRVLVTLAAGIGGLVDPDADFSAWNGSIGLDVDAAFVWWASRSVGVTAGLRAGVGPAIDLRTLAVDGAAGWGWLEAGLAF